MCGCLNMSVTCGTARREDSANFLFVEFNFALGRGNVKHAGLGSPAADTCKPHEVPGKPCAVDGTHGNFYAFSSPANEKSGFHIHIQNVPCELTALSCTLCSSWSLFASPSLSFPLLFSPFLSFPLRSSPPLLSLCVDDQKEIF